MPNIIATADAPAAIGPYVQARVSGNFIFVSGQLGLTPDGAMPDDFSAQARNALKNLSAILEAAGSSLAKVLKTTVFLGDIADFQTFNAIYNEYFTPPYPARSCFAVKSLPRNAAVEIEAIAEL